MNQVPNLANLFTSLSEQLLNFFIFFFIKLNFLKNIKIFIYFKIHFHITFSDKLVAYKNTFNHKIINFLRQK